jgi:NADH-quinone oxidoreductase subunit M
VGAALGTEYAAGYQQWLYQRTAFGEPTEEFSGGGHGGPAHALSAAVNTGGAGSASDEPHGGSSRSAAEASPDHHDDIHDVTPIEWVAWTPFLVAILVFGVYPQLMFEVMDPAVTALVDQMGATLG